MSEHSYLVTARKYRPVLFHELVAQEHVTDTLKNALRLDRLAHAYLFSGPRGVGKTTAARILAKAINCQTPRDERADPSEPCRTCTSCRDFEEGRSLSIFEIDAASNNKVEDVRELRETVRIPPQGSKKKVYIIDEVHMLSNAAFNALLKTLEEPPSHALFIFATTEPHKVLPTILSRCQRFDFRRISVPTIVQHLRKICAEESVTADEEALILIARKGDGALRDALSAFDQSVVLCGSNLTYADLASALRVMDVDLFFEVTRNVTERSTRGMLALVDRIVRAGFDFQEFLSGLAEHIRNLLVARTSSDMALVETAEATRERYLAESKAFSETVLLRLLTVVDAAAEGIAASSHPRLKLELALLRMAGLSDAVDLKEAVEQLRHLQKMANDGKLTPGVVAAPVVTPRAVQAESPKPARPAVAAAKKREPAPAPVMETTKAPPPRKKEVPAPPGGSAQKTNVTVGQQPTLFDHVDEVEPEGTVPPTQASGPEKLMELWPALVRSVQEEKIQVGVLLKNSRPLGIRNGELEVGVPNAFHQNMLATDVKTVLKHYRTLSGPNVASVAYIVQEGVQPAVDEKDASPVDPKEYLKQQRQENPVIDAIFEQFGGEIVW